MSLECLNYYASIGKACAEMANPVKVYGGFYLHKASYSIPTAANIADQDFIKTEIAAQNLYPIQNIIEVENQDTEGGTEETGLQRKIHLFDGIRGSLYSCAMTLEAHKILRSYNGGAWKVIYIDINKTLVFTENSDGTFGGIDLGYFWVHSLKTPSIDGSVKSMIEIQELDNDDIDVNGKFINPTWNPLKLYGPLLVQAVNGTVATNAWTTTVQYEKNDEYDEDGQPIVLPISGLDETTLVAKDLTGVVPAGYAVVETVAGSGVYDCSATAFTEGTNQVVASATSNYSSVETALTS